MTDEELTEYARQGQGAYQMVSVEVARQLRVAAEEFSAGAERQTAWMIWLTVAVAVLTFALLLREILI
jgi:hypothetical protein